MTPQILFNDKYINVRITPKQLERTEVKGGSKRKINDFRRNPRRIISRICKSYSITPSIVQTYTKDKLINNERADHEIQIELKELHISTSAYAVSKSKAWRKLVYKLHHLYTLSIISK